MSFFSKIFGNKNKYEVLSNYSLIGTDMHSHLIPGIDDGSKDLEDSINLIKRMMDLGYRKFITTPHIMSDFFKNNPEIILGGLEEVRAELKRQNIDVKIEAAAEYYLDFEFESKIENDKLLTFGNNYLLFEVSYMNEPENVLSTVFKLQLAGYKPVLAHPERYPFWHRKFEYYQDLSERGVLLQMNINSLSGHYGPGCKRIAQQMIDNNLISFIGTDCHHMGHTELLQKTLKDKHLSKLLASGKLLNSTL
jgi:protein-tyrosine phosphatase